MCLDCSNITLPQGNTGNTGPTGATGAAGTNGTDGVDGASLIDALFTRLSTSATSLSEITNIPIDVTKAFVDTGDGLEYEIYYSYTYTSGTDGGNVQLSLEDGINTIALLNASPISITQYYAGIVVTGTIIRRSDSSINHTRHIRQVPNNTYSSPTDIISGKVNNEVYTTTVNPGTIDNTSANLILSAKGILNSGTNTINVEFFKLKAIKKLV